MTISEKVAYLKGLAEGLGLETEKSKEGKLISVMIGILEEVGLTIEDLEENSLALGEEIDNLSDDLAEIESIFAHDHEEHEEDCCGHAHHHHDEDEFELSCPACDAPIEITEEVIAQGNVTCANCEAVFSLGFPDEGEEDCCGGNCACGCGDENDD